MRLAMACVLAGALAFSPQGVSARSPVNKWLCSVLKSPFDARAALKAFPLEKLPDAVESRKVDGEGDDGHTHVELLAEGDTYKVGYRYSYKNSDVTDPYGFELYVATADYIPNFQKTIEGWLEEWGKPEQFIIGRRVTVGAPLFEGGEPAFYIATWSSGRYEADWFNAKHIKRAEQLCGGK
jgi:hypothetical protein